LPAQIFPVGLQSKIIKSNLSIDNYLLLPS
jgi:hypothetical protein